MRYDLPCEIVEDLLPSYIDELTNDVSTEAVRSHLETCDKCRKMYELMTGKEMITVDEEDKAEIDFLKKSKKVSRKRIVTAVIATLAVIFLFLGYRGLIAGKTCDPSLVNYELYVDNEFVTISGDIIDDKQGVKSVSYSVEDGKMDINIETTGASFIHKNTFESSQGIDEPLKEVTINGSVIAWSDGEYISPKVSEIYMAKHEYIGDMPANGELAEAIGLSEIIGAYTNELQTDKEPYGWKFIADSNFDKEEAAVLEERFRSYGSILLAAVDNLGEVECEYLCNGKTKSVKVTCDDAGKLAGKDIKECGATAGSLQKMIEKLPMLDFRFTSGNLGLYLEGDLNISMVNQAEDDIYEIGLTYYVNGEAKGTVGTSPADGSAFDEEDLGSTAIAIERDVRNKDEDILSVSMTVTDKDGRSYDAGIVELGTINEMKEKFKGSYSPGSRMFNLKCTLSGSYDKGFGIQVE